MPNCLPLAELKGAFQKPIDQNSTRKEEEGNGKEKTGTSFCSAEAPIWSYQQSLLWKRSS